MAHRPGERNSARSMYSYKLALRFLSSSISRCTFLHLMSSISFRRNSTSSVFLCRCSSRSSTFLRRISFSVTCSIIIISCGGASKSCGPAMCEWFISRSAFIYTTRRESTRQTQQ